MLPPPEALFATKEEIINHVNTFSRTQGYVTVIQRSKPGLAVYAIMAVTTRITKMLNQPGMLGTA